MHGGTTRAIVSLSALSALLAIGAPGAGAAPTVTATVTTTLAGQPLPRDTVTATWAVAGGKNALHVSGFNLPGATTVVTATWLGTRHVDRAGTLTQLHRTYTYEAALDRATAVFVTEYRTATGWVRLPPLRDHYVASPLLITAATELVIERVPALAGRTVPVRLTITLTFPDPATRIDDTITI
jgi:hypothetical protein